MTLTSHRRGARYGAEPEDECADLARQVLPGAHWMPQGVSPKKLPSWASFFETDHCLVVVVHPGATQIERALVYGLHHASGRQLHLVLPEDQSSATGIEATRVRAAFLIAPIAIWTYDDTLELRAIGPLTPPEAFELRRSAESRFKAEAIGAGLAWVDELATRLASLGLVADRGRGIWYLRGVRMVVLESNAQGVRLMVGAARGAVEAERFEVAAAAGPDAGTIGRIEARISEDAAADWFASRTKQYAEHDLQSRITAGEIDLGWIPSILLREYPGQRATGKLGFIDFLGLDTDGALHIVEMKLGDQDEMLILQGLDYWIWVQANRALLESDLGATWIDVRLDFVVTSKAGQEPHQRNRYWEAVRSVLAPEVVERFTEV